MMEVQNGAQVEEVWTKEQIESLKGWVNSQAGKTELRHVQESNRESSKVIATMAIVDVNDLKMPFTYSI